MVEKGVLLMESIEKLRSRIKNGTLSVKTLDEFMEIADEIEREIAERYMLRPVDRKGEPWHLGDMFAFEDGNGRKRTCTVSGLGDGEVFFFYDQHRDSAKQRHFNAKKLIHVKQRTIEDVLRELLRDTAHYFPSDCEDDIARAADEIRGLL